MIVLHWKLNDLLIFNKWNKHAEKKNSQMKDFKIHKLNPFDLFTDPILKGILYVKIVYYYV